KPYAEKWLVERDLKPKTLYHYKDLLATRIYPAFGERRVTAIATPMVRTWLAAQEGAPTRKKQAYGLLKSILNTAVSDGLIDGNPCQMVVKA
ncbi:phage integrase central domain-containing protein, partial [Mycobacterium kansasii]